MQTTIYTWNNKLLLLLCWYLPGSGSLPTSRLYQPASSSSSSSLTSLKPGATSSVETNKKICQLFHQKEINLKLNWLLGEPAKAKTFEGSKRETETFCVIAINWSLHLLFFSLTFYAACSVYNNKNSRFLSVSTRVYPQVLLVWFALNIEFQCKRSLHFMVAT